ncbi:MAG: Rossmann-like and DUF2520 domain-containing protein [Planctomycetota bacterium]
MSASVPPAASASPSVERELVIAGAGAAGAAIARAARLAGWSLGAVACRSVERAQARCARIGAGRPTSLAALGDPVAHVPARPVLLLVAVPDRHIAEQAEALARQAWPAHSCALHLSGAVEITALAPLRAAGLALGGMHPLKSFVDLERDAASLAGTVWALEGDAAALQAAEHFTTSLGGKSFRLAPGSRPAWHAAATHACNHFVALVDQALDLIAAAGLSRDEGRRALLPLLASTLDNLRAHPPGTALTGPVVRGDEAAVRRHLQALEGLPADVAAAYRALASRAVHLAQSQRGLPAGTAASILKDLRS